MRERLCGRRGMPLWLVLSRYWVHVVWKTVWQSTPLPINIPPVSLPRPFAGSGSTLSRVVLERSLVVLLAKNNDDDDAPGGDRGVAWLFVCSSLDIGRSQQLRDRPSPRMESRTEAHFSLTLVLCRINHLKPGYSETFLSWLGPENLQGHR